jgi:hypothetical protein
VNNLPQFQTDAPAARERSGAGTEERTFDATANLPDGEAPEMSAFAPITGHPGFYRRTAGGRVFFRIRDQRGRRRWASAETIKAAERKKAELETDVRRGEYREQTREGFATYARRWIESYRGRTARGISERTRTDYRLAFEREAIPFFGEMPLGQIEPSDVREYAHALERRGLAPNTVRLAVAPVRALLATAVEDGLLRSNPAAGLRLAQRRPNLDGEEREQVKAMSEAELARVLVAIRTSAPSWSLFFRFLAWSGCGSARRSSCAGRTSTSASGSFTSAAVTTPGTSGHRSRATASAACG